MVAFLQQNLKSNQVNFVISPESLSNILALQNIRSVQALVLKDKTRQR